MLRLPPTSIDLSEKDVAFHLQQLDIYHGLLKQGFRKDDILRYMNEHNQAKQQRLPTNNDDLSTASTVDLALLNSDPPVVHVSPPQSDDPKSMLTPDHFTVAEGKYASPFEDASSPPEPSQDLPIRHAPRQSSLLRFTELASPAHSEEPDGIARGHKGLQGRKYRPRTDTYSYSQSEMSDSALTSVETREDSDHEATIGPARSMMRAEAQTFIPNMHLVVDNDPQLILQPAEPTRARRRHGDGQDFEIHHDLDAGNTPPSTPPATSSISPLLSLETWISGNSHNTPPAARTVPRSQQLDGHFSVYHDALPSLSQPQTPLELERHPILSPRYAAYTAPPGMLRSVNRSRHQHPLTDDNTGSQTPTARAISIRERRARELRRLVGVETARLDRLRLDDGDQDAQTTATELHNVTESDAWRNGLEADRTGDENWEFDARVHNDIEQGIRIVSGNARNAV